ncbi:MAG: sensor histidine kinase [Bacteroidales bacterium]
MIQLSDHELLNEIKRRLDEKEKSLRELTILSEKLMDVNKKLSDSEALKTHFLANIRNEIVNPFSSILGLSKHLANCKTYDRDKIMTMASLIHSEAFDLNFQFKNIFAAAEIEAGEVMLEFAKVNVVSILDETVKAFNLVAKSKKIEIIIDNRLDPLNNAWYFITDPIKFEMILSNVLKNAIEFSFENGEVYIIVEFDDKNDLIVVSFKDQGIGIPPEEHQRIFDRFYKRDLKIHSANKGHGLGLSIVSFYVEMMGGTIRLESEPGKGSVFIVSIPQGNLSAVSGLSEFSNEMLFDQSEKF